MAVHGWAASDRERDEREQPPLLTLPEVERVGRCRCCGRRVHNPPPWDCDLCHDAECLTWGEPRPGCPLNREG